MDLNREQMLAVEHNKGPALVLAIPGSGKTTVIINRAKYLTEKLGVCAKDILTVTFSKSSSADMKNKLSEILKFKDFKEINIMTIHSLAYRILKDYENKQNFSYKLIDFDMKYNKKDIIKHLYCKLYGSYPNEDKIDEIESDISFHINTCSSFNKMKYENIFIEYIKFKEKNKLIDFDDMLIKAYNLLSDDPYIKKKYKNRFKYFMLDEGQDTSELQYLILDKLMNKEKNFFVVADDDQSIYSFRGANNDRILNFKEYYKDGKIYRLKLNYRSGDDIINYANKIIKNNKIRHKKTILAAKDMKADVVVKEFNKSKEQYSYIISYIKNNTNEDIAILYRNNMSMIPMVEYLERNMIEFFSFDKKDRFFSHYILRDVLDIIQLSHNPDDPELYKSVYFKIKGYISKREIDSVYGKTSLSLIDELIRLKDLKEYKRKLLLELKKDLFILKNLKPYYMIDYIEKNMSYKDYLRNNMKECSDSFKKQCDVLYYLKMVARSTSTVKEFVQRLKLLREKILCDTKRNVFLSTLHGSKGLEFTSVFLIDIVEDELPLNLSDLDDYGIEEERRLFYVGITRAKKKLHIFSYKNKNNYESNKSIFISELFKEDGM